MKTPFTPGPWFNVNGLICQHGDTSGATVCDMAEPWFVDGVEANSNLICAAPDMLAALENLYQHCAMIHNIWGDGCNQKEADAAIAAGKAAILKARGETP